LKVLAYPWPQDWTLEEIVIHSANNHIFGHSAAIGNISVAAYPAQDQNSLEPFSSRGPTKVYDRGGQTFVERQTPVITATDGVQTSVVPDFNPFFGTSAAAPHIAGIAALYFDKYPNDSYWTFMQMLTESASTLGNIGQGGTYNDQSGFGKANAQATLARRATAKSVTLSQLDEQSQNFGQIGVWNGAWDYVPVPITIQWSESSIGLKADQNYKPSTTQKYHDWNAYGDVVNPKDFDIPGSSATFTSYFKTSSNVTIQAQLIEGGNPSGNVEFRDPWLIDAYANGGPYNRGKDDAIWYTKPSPFTPSTSSNYMGVFLNENPSYNPNYAIYKIRVPQTQSINGFTSYFKNWVASGANIPYPNNLENPVVFQSAGATVTAKYKAHMGSGSGEATSSNNGRRVVSDNTGNNYYLVYESMGEICYTFSTDNGVTWAGEVQLSSGNGNNKCPTLVVNGNKIYVLWQRYTSGSNYTIYFRSNLGSSWGSTISLGSITCSSPNNPLPALTVKEVRPSGTRKVRLVAAWKTNSGISHRYSDNDGTSWSSAALLPSTGSSHKSPSLSPGASFDWTFLDIYASYDNGSTILLNKYHTNLSNNTTAWGTPETVPGSSGTTASCSQVTSDANEPQPHAYIVWQGIDPIIEAEGVYYQRKSGTDGSWSAVQSYVKEFQKPSITNLASGNLAMLWDDYSSIYKATYDYGTGTWSARQLVAAGFSPNTSISFGIYNPPSAAKYIWTSGTSSPYNLNLSSESLQKQELFADKYHRRVTAADSTQALLMVDLGDIYLRLKDGAAIPLKLTAVDDTLLTRTAEKFWSYLDSEPCFVPSDAESLVMELGVYTQDSEKLRASPSSHLTIALQIVDAEDHDDLLQVGNEEVVSESGRMIENKAAEISSWAKRKVYTRVLVSGLDAKAEGLAYILTHVYDGHALGQFEKEDPAAQTSTGVPKVFDLTQNYPNPFNPETNITYALPQASNVRIEIYNILGQKIVTLFDADMPAGNHSVRWNGRNAIDEKVGAGIYLCRMQAGEFVKSQKMTLLP